MEALEDFAASTNDLFRISCRFECPLPVLINDIQVAQHLYRIAQEAVGNAIKHGRARNIEIRLEAHKGGKRLCIIDDGTGRPPFSPDGKGMGLRIMSYRADRIGAMFGIRRRDPVGTIVICFLPQVPVMREPVL
jgi:signal transduction histidine kinase